MLKRLPGFAALWLVLLLSPCLLHAAAPTTEAQPRVTALYTTWDDYYFYAGFQVNDPNVVGKNATPISQPQQDDDVEVFFETDHARAHVRTPQTFQMAVSAAKGAYFSVGSGTTIPKAKAVYTYKYAVTVDGTLNDSSNRDLGYAVELAIPWQELGQSGPPKAGAVWGFNAISRDRNTLVAPGSRFYSLSPNVKSAADVQNPSQWSEIVFSPGGSVAASTLTRVVSPHVGARFPIINGEMISGEWPSSGNIAFGASPIEAAAPTEAEEPNTNVSPFQTPPAEVPIVVPPKKVARIPAPETTAPEPAYPNAIPLPGGGSIKVVPGGIKNPRGFEIPAPVTAPASPETGASVNPLTPKLPPKYRPSQPAVSLTGSLTLGPAQPPHLVMALYRLDYNGDSRKAPPQNVWDAAGRSLLADQPINGCGSWFSGLRPLWHRQQLSDLRRSGIDVALIEAHVGDPLLGHEMDALVAALKEMKARGQDYPLLGVYFDSDTPPIRTIYAHIPEEFRATLAVSGQNRPGVVVYSNDKTVTAADNAALALDDGTAALLTPADNVAVVSPGRADAGGVIPRNGGQTYTASWQKAMDSKANFVVIDSWNDFTHGTEIAATRQYGEHYADDTRLDTIAFNGSKQWHAKYLSAQVPPVLSPKALYQVPVRIENAGTLPWRAGEDYSLSVRWYKDGRLYDDSAPHLPIGVDVMPGQSATLSVGVVARNGYGEDIEPGQYTLVFDIVQGQDRWFSYADDVPLQVPVTVVAVASDLKPSAAFLGTVTPTSMQSGAAYPTQVQVRNDSAQSWTSGDTLAYKIQTVSGGTVRTVAESHGEALSARTLFPGEAAQVVATVALKTTDGQSLPPGEYRLHWYVRPTDGQPAISGSYDEALEVVASDPGASFVLSDIPRTVDSGKDLTAKLAVQNLGAQTWSKATTRIGYHWYYLDGMEAQWDGGTLTPLTKDVPPGGIDGAIVAKAHAPSRPGRYALVFDMRAPDGAWASTSPASKGEDLLQVLVTVGGRGDATPLDLSKYLTGDGVVESGASGGDFDGQGDAWPGVMLPPDGTAEAEGNPVFFNKPIPPLYPSGYYAAQSGSGWNANHSVPFLYPPASGKNLIACQGQSIPLPGGDYTTLHILAAATGGHAVSAAFGLRGSGAQTTQTLSIADWGSAPSGPGASLAFQSPYRRTHDGLAQTPAMLGDYTLSLAAVRGANALILPTDPAIKIIAITLVK